jgi:hypothetical protein
VTRNRNFNRLIFFGMIFLVIGSSLRLLPRVGVMSEAWSDAVIGFFYGLAIACMLLGWKRNASSKCNSSLPPAA